MKLWNDREIDGTRKTILSEAAWSGKTDATRSPLHAFRSFCSLGLWCNLEHLIWGWRKILSGMALKG